MFPTRTTRVLIEGLVQGVGYRARVSSTACSLGLTGWVRNRQDGSVEAVFHGSPERVDEILRRCEKGPPAALVTAVGVTGIEAGTYDDFYLLPTC